MHNQSTSRIVVAFLQNQWFKDPERMQKIRNQPPWSERPRHEWNATWLFSGGLTGQRLRAAFAEELCDEIIWEEASEDVGGKSSCAFAADIPHILRVLAEHKPTHVLALGKIATDALCEIHSNAEPTWRLITGPHPAARVGDTFRKLQEMRDKLERVSE